MRWVPRVLLAATLIALALPARAYVPQTITVDGVNDFDPSNMLNDDRTDTQSGCGVGIYPMDLGRVYVTNDNNFLYIGIEFSKSCYCDMNLGFAIDVGTSAGGTTDPFGRKIGWTNFVNKPDFVVYDVTPTNCNTFNYEVFYKDSVGVWLNKSTLINPSWGSGSNGLGIVDSVNFRELRLPLSVLGVSAGSNLNLEFWVTQEGTSKGPLDALASDDVQMSRGSSTTYDTTAVVQMTTMFPYTVLNATDNTPPTVSSATAVNFTVLPNKQFSTSTNRVDVVFSEPVDLTTAQTTTNYTVSGPVSRTVVTAARDASALNVVHLTLNLPVNANAAFYNVTVQNVKDVANNTIVNDGTYNVGSFFIQNLVFNADMSVNLCSGLFAPTDTFAVEGSLPPLTFSLCDNAILTDANADSIYTTTVPFCMAKDRVTNKAEASLEWKMTRNCNQYEGFAGNRTVALSSDNGATVTLDVAWNNDDPANFISHPIDVVFQVNGASKGLGPADVVTLQGNVAPLSFTPPGAPMLDDGVSPDLVAGDKIYTAKVRFAACTYQQVEWKVAVNGAFECPDQGNRSFTLDEAGADTVGGALGPQTLPARGIDRCQVTDKAIAVLFTVDMFPSGVPVPSAFLNGDRAPLTFDIPPAVSGQMTDDGVSPDAQAGDYIYTKLVTFPDSTGLTLAYKFVRDTTYECTGYGNRTLFLDDTQYSVAVPIVHPLDRWDYCTVLDVPGVVTGPLRPGSSADFANLLQSFPNPGFARSTIRFDLKRGGRVTLTVYDVAGRRVAKLVDGELKAGTHEAVWNGLDASGHRVQAGLYLYELSMNGERLTRRLVLSK